MEIKIRELCKSYGKKKALQNFDATFENGIYGILGPNGAGKSTLMNILTDNLLRDSGRILCGGKDILKWGGLTENHSDICLSSNSCTKRLQ